MCLADKHLFWNPWSQISKVYKSSYYIFFFYERLQAIHLIEVKRVYFAFMLTLKPYETSLNLQFNADNLDICTKVLLKSCSNAHFGGKTGFWDPCAVVHSKVSGRESKRETERVWDGVGQAFFSEWQERAWQPRWKITVQRWLKWDTLYSLDLGSLAIRGSVAAEREREKMMHAVLFQSSFLPFSKGLSDILFLLLHPSPWLRRSQIPVFHFTTATWVSVQRYHFKQGTEMPLRPAALVYIMQMGTGEGQRITVFCKNKELLCFIELHNGESPCRYLQCY